MKIKNRKKNDRAAFWRHNNHNPNLFTVVGAPISLAELAGIIQAGQDGGFGAAIKKSIQQQNNC